MSLEPRSVSMKAAWAQGAQTNIPIPPVEGVAYRNSAITAANVQQGQIYKQLYDSARYNEVLYRATSLVKQFEEQGFATHSPETNYIAGAGIAYGQDGIIYIATQNSGPRYGGAQDPVYTNGYWETFAESIMRSGGGGTFPGMITPFSGSFSGKNPINTSTNSPMTNWHICDGTDGTPNLQDRFIVGASTSKAAGSIGGGDTINLTISGNSDATTLDLSQIPAHGHSYRTYSGNSPADGGPNNFYLSSGVDDTTGDAGGGGAHFHGLSDARIPLNNSTALPPYYALAFIIRMA